jgi:hypothetical protein
MLKILNFWFLKCILQKVFPVQKGYKNKLLYDLKFKVASIIPLSALKFLQKSWKYILYFVYMYKNMKYTYVRMYYSFSAVQCHCTVQT